MYVFNKLRFINVEVLIYLLIFFFRLPTIILMPGIELLTSYNVFRIILLFIFIYLTLFLHKNGKDKILVVSLCLLLLIISISSLFTINIVEYLSNYKTILFSFILFITYYNTVQSKNIQSLLTVLILATGLNVLIQLYLYISNDQIILHNLFHIVYIQFYEFDKQRGRFFGSTYDESLIPIIYYLFTKEKSTIVKVTYLFIIICITFITLISNWRTKMLILLGNFIFILFYSFSNKTSKNKIFIMAFCVFVMCFLALNKNDSSFQRFNLSEENSISTVLIRISYWRESFELIKTHFFTGVGLGNYYDNLLESSKLQKLAYSRSYINQNHFNNFVFINDPHNIFISIFVSSGFAGFIMLFVLIYAILKKTVYIFRRYNSNSAFPFIAVSLWSLLFFSLFNPFIDFPYLSLIAILLTLIFL